MSVTSRSGTGRCACGAPLRGLSKTQIAELTAAASTLRGLPPLLGHHRAVRGLSLREAARQIGVAASTLARYENGEDASLSTILAILDWIARTTS